MIDINLARRDPGGIRVGLKNRGGRYLPAFEELLALDAEYRRLLAEVERLRAKRNASSQLIGKAKAGKDEKQAAVLMAEAATLKTDLKEKEDAVASLAAKTHLAALSLPNIPHESVPVGSSEADNKELRRAFEPPQPDFKPLDHQTLGEKLGILDFAAAAKLSGSRFALWRGAGAKLLRSVISFQLDKHSSAGYQEIWPPALVRPEILEG